MGQQQLLLIVLGVIIVGIAVVVGINLFNANAEEAAKDGVVSDCTNLGAMAQQHYKKPGSMGGGANTFDGTGTNGVTWAIPANLVNTANGTYSATVGAQTVDLVGDPLETSYTWTVQTQVTPTSILTVIQ
ncbi:MAG: hypothetical protein OEM46_00525 [Ignavibacteria bacterium]|nr:hypothetical protein [Ignavibacteria bacterium]